MIRKSLLTILLLISSAPVFALGLGGIKVDSALNQPLDAKVRLISVGQMAVDDIRVKLAGPADFKRAGVDRPFLLSKLRFKPVFPENGEPYIQVSTRETVREPFLDFLLEVSWPQGNLVREFTILLDPPSYQPPQAESVAVPETRRQPSPAASSYGPVRNTETLWVIAGKVQTDPGVSRNRTMVALLKANPDAFHKGNINLLKKGALLTIPVPGEIAAVTEEEARATVKQQMAEWRKGRQRTTPPAPVRPGKVADVAPVPGPLQTEPAPDSEAMASESRQAAEKPRNVAGTDRATEERLKVVEPDKNWQPGEKSETGYPIQESERLREAIKDSEQELVAVQEINKDIIELRAALESKVDALKKALEEKDAQLENLRRQIARVGAAEGVIRPGEGQAEERAGLLPVEAPPPGNVAVTAPVTEISTDNLIWKDEYWMILMGAIIVILSILLLLNRRGARRVSAFETPELFEMSTDVASADASEMSSAADIVAEPAELRMTPVQPPRSQGDQEISLLPEKSSDIASILMEADIYLAYRRYSQAESLIEEAMELNPESPELKAKLLEIYAFRRDKKSFSHYLDQIYPLLMNQSPELWEKVVDMGRLLVPEHPAWQQDEVADAARPVTPETVDDALTEDDSLRQTPFDLDIDFGDLEVSASDSEPVTFEDLIQHGNKPEDDDIPTIDIDFDFDGPDDPKDPQKDR